MPPRALNRLRKLCLSLPEVFEVRSHGEPTFRVKNKMFATFANADNHHGRGRHGVWIKAAPGRQARMVGFAPDRFFVPPYVGPSGWLGVWLDGACDWDELGDIVRSAHRLAAPKRLLAQLDADPKLAKTSRRVYGPPLPRGRAHRRRRPL